MENQKTGALNWDSTISQESSFVLLEPGEYDFTVKKMTRGMHTPSGKGKIDVSSPQAELELSIYNDQGQEATVFENLILHTATEWKISEFFIAIGQKIPGQDFVPNWNVVGAKGRAEISINEYTSRDGKDRKNNRVEQFLPPNNTNQNSGQTNQQANQQPAGDQWTPNQGVNPNPQQINQGQQPQNQDQNNNQNSNPGFAF